MLRYDPRTLIINVVYFVFTIWREQRFASNVLHVTLNTRLLSSGVCILQWTKLMLLFKLFHLLTLVRFGKLAT